MHPIARSLALVFQIHIAAIPERAHTDPCNENSRSFVRDDVKKT